MGSNQHHHHTTAGDGVSQRLNSSRFSGPMTRRAQSFKRTTNNNNINTTNNNNQINPSNNTHHEIDLQLNSPRSEFANSADGQINNHYPHHNHFTQRTHLKRHLGFGSIGVVELGFVLIEKKKKLGHWMFFVFCGVCLFLGVLKISANCQLENESACESNNRFEEIGVVFSAINDLCINRQHKLSKSTIYV